MKEIKSSAIWGESIQTVFNILMESKPSYTYFNGVYYEANLDTTIDDLNRLHYKRKFTSKYNNLTKKIDIDRKVLEHINSLKNIEKIDEYIDFGILIEWSEILFKLDKEPQDKHIDLIFEYMDLLNLHINLPLLPLNPTKGDYYKYVFNLIFRTLRTERCLDGSLYLIYEEFNKMKE